MVGIDSFDCDAAIREARVKIPEALNKEIAGLRAKRDAVLRARNDLRTESKHHATFNLESAREQLRASEKRVAEIKRRIEFLAGQSGKMNAEIARLEGSLSFRRPLQSIATLASIARGKAQAKASQDDLRRERAAAVAATRRRDSERKAIEAYTNYDAGRNAAHLKMCKKRLAEVEAELRERSKHLDGYMNRLSPLFAQYDEVAGKLHQLNDEIVYLEDARHRLDDTDGYGRRLIHEECERRFGNGRPGSLLTERFRRRDKIERDIAKIGKRIGEVSAIASRKVRALVLDGSNLCFKGGEFIGPAALVALAKHLAASYKVTIVMDHSTCHRVRSLDACLPGGVEFRETAPGKKADEVLLNLAGNDETVFVISNDRFAEFGEKPAVRDRRIIRHEIVGRTVQICDLDVSVGF